jgi:hypothetical protein
MAGARLRLDPAPSKRGLGSETLTDALEPEDVEAFAGSGSEDGWSGRIERPIQNSRRAGA